MAKHFAYKHLPAAGLGHRDPRRPHVTGGIGGGIPVFTFDILEQRIYRDRSRSLMVLDRDLLIGAKRSLVSEVRGFATISKRALVTQERILMDIDRALIAIDRVIASESRSMKSIDRDLH